ncbi:MAG: bifunctional nuclease family protein [Candidatus Thermoplasmatota archaeon]|nr:bifunctional nuclease family protein [Candidatus Thermoplasmatota archaeon]
MAEQSELVRCDVDDVKMSTQGPVVLLVPEDDPSNVLPIFIDHAQAFNIQSALTGQVPPRPMTHDLMNHIVQEMGGVVERVVVEELAQSTFFASLFVDVDSNGSAEHHHFDVRPSDGIALAVRAQAPIFVRRKVLDEAALDRSSIQGEDLTVERTDEDIDLGVEP